MSDNQRQNVTSPQEKVPANNKDPGLMTKFWQKSKSFFTGSAVTSNSVANTGLPNGKRLLVLNLINIIKKITYY